MSTRSTVKIENFTLCKIYKHWDGSPEFMLPWLNAFNKNFAEQRGNDPQYKIASLLRSSAFDSEKYSLDNSRCTGYGLIPFDADFGQEYEYTLHENGTVTFLEL